MESNRVAGKDQTGFIARAKLFSSPSVPKAKRANFTHSEQTVPPAPVPVTFEEPDEEPMEVDETVHEEGPERVEPAQNERKSIASSTTPRRKSIPTPGRRLFVSNKNLVHETENANDATEKEKVPNKNKDESTVLELLQLDATLLPDVHPMKFVLHEKSGLQEYQNQLDKECDRFQSSKLLYFKQYNSSINRSNNPSVTKHITSANTGSRKCLNEWMAEKRPTSITMDLFVKFNEIKPETPAIADYKNQYEEEFEKNRKAKMACDAMKAIQYNYANNTEAKKDFERKIELIKKKAKEAQCHSEQVDELASTFQTIETF